MEPIGIIHTEFSQLEDMPVQPRGASETEAEIEIFPEFTEGLTDLDGFSHIYLIYRFHLSQGYALTITPFLDDKPHGLFATRAPKRPNPIGLSIVELLSINDNRLTICGADVADGTPLLDIKPYIDNFDRVENARSGWMTSSTNSISEMRSDSRFIGDKQT